MRIGLPVIALIASTGSVLAQSANDFSSIDAVANPDPAAIASVFPDGAPNLFAPDSMATSYRLPRSIEQSQDPNAATNLKYSDGQLQYEFGTNMKTNRQVTSIVPQVPDPHIVGGAAGGSGELKGQIRTPEGQWEIFGSQRFGMNDGGPPVAQDATTLGSAYLLPDWMAGGKIAASVELAPTDERKARIEYRQKFGPAEAFVGAEQTFIPHQTESKAPAAVRGGVARKF